MHVDLSLFDQWLFFISFFPEKVQTATDHIETAFYDNVIHQVWGLKSVMFVAMVGRNQSVLISADWLSLHNYSTKQYPFFTGNLLNICHKN